MISSRIFVSIAAYRDPQLVPTVLDCMAKANRPDMLRFGICQQRDVGDEALPFAADGRFRILDVDWRESKGACWARAETMKLWEGEEWFLQVDSHCRFAKGWDEMLIRMAAETGSGKPVLSTYATAFTPAERREEERLEGGPLQMILQAFTAEGIPQMRPGAMPAGRRSKLPMRARFLAAGFLFAPGSFVAEVPYDPELYFMGEEIAMTLRAFTHGYDLFHPTETVVWHDYIRADARKHWDDHEVAHGAHDNRETLREVLEVEPSAGTWRERDDASKRKVQRILRGERVESFGLGGQRTIQEYEDYAGLSFRKKVAQHYTLRGDEPPNATSVADWTERVYPWIARVRFKKESLPDGALDDPSIWSVSLFDKDGVEICRRDLSADDLAPFIAAGVDPKSNEELAVICEFASETAPVSWTLLPRGRSGRWLKKMGGILPEQDFAILKEDLPESESEA